MDLNYERYRCYSTQVIILGNRIEISNILAPSYLVRNFRSDIINLHLLSDSGRLMVFNFIGNHFYLLDDDLKVMKLRLPECDDLYKIGIGTFTNVSVNGFLSLDEHEIVLEKTPECRGNVNSKTYGHLLPIDYKVIEADVIKRIEEHNSEKLPGAHRVDYINLDCTTGKFKSTVPSSIAATYTNSLVYA